MTKFRNLGIGEYFLYNGVTHIKMGDDKFLSLLKNNAVKNQILDVLKPVKRIKLKRIEHEYYNGK